MCIEIYNPQRYSQRPLLARRQVGSAVRTETQEPASDFESTEPRRLCSVEHGRTHAKASASRSPAPRRRPDRGGARADPDADGHHHSDSRLDCTGDGYGGDELPSGGQLLCAERPDRGLVIAGVHLECSRISSVLVRLLLYGQLGLYGHSSYFFWRTDSAPLRIEIATEARQPLPP